VHFAKVRWFENSLIKLHWLPIATWNTNTPLLCLLVYQALDRLAPSYMADMLHPVTTLDRPLTPRSADNNDRFITSSRLRLGERAFNVAAPRVWNSLPSDLKILSKHLQSLFCSVKTVVVLTHNLYTVLQLSLWSCQ